jgi:hypothetical protein
VVIYEKDGKTIATRAKTDEQGAYSISLAPGSYCLFVPTKDERDRVVGIRRDISVGPSEHQTLNLSVDRGGK